MTADEIAATKEAWYRLGYLDIREDEPSVPELLNWLNDQHNDLVSAKNDLVAILDSPEGQDFRRRLRAVVAAGPAQAAASVPPHEHTGSVTVK